MMKEKRGEGERRDLEVAEVPPAIQFVPQPPVNFVHAAGSVITWYPMSMW